MKYFSALFALLLCTVLPAQTQRSLGASEADFWRDFSKLYSEFLPKKEADEDLLSLKSVYASRRLIGIRYSSVAGKRPTNPLRTFVCINEV